MAKTRDSSPIDQNNVLDAFWALEMDHSAQSIDLVTTCTENKWLKVYAQCLVEVNGDLRMLSTAPTYVTPRGPELLRVQWTHLTGLWHIVEREKSGLPRLIGL